MSGRSAILSVALWGLFLAGIRIAVVPPETCGDDRTEAIAGAAERALGWMKRNQLPDGRYVYLYYADTDTVSDDYNEVRHAGVTMALYQAAGRYGDPQALAVADKGLAWMKARVERRHGWAALSGGGPDLKLGATALMTVALAERRLATADTDYDGLMRDLGGFLAALQRPDGGFHVGWQLDSEQPVIYGTSRYYPGEAFWALALLHEAFPGEGWDEAARRAGEFITTRRDELEDVDFPPLADQWAAYGLAEVSEGGLTDAQIRYARRLAERFGFLTRIEAQRQHGALGRLVRGQGSRGAGMGTWMEGMAALWRLASTDKRLADIRPALEERLRCASGILAARQIGETEAAQHPRPGLMDGAWVRDGETRMDDQQHAFSGLLYTLDALNGRTEREPDSTLAARER